MIQHVTWEVRREAADESAGFYELLGFRRVQPPPSLADRAVWLQSGPTQVHLMYVSEPVSLPRGHVAVVVEDWDGTLERLRAGGHEAEPRREHWGSPRAYVRDPAGNLVELMEFPPPG